MSKRLLAPATSLLLALVAGGCGDGSTPPGQARRVILISCDTLRADRLGFYGYERDTSPNLDALAAESVVFEETYSTAPMTVSAVISADRSSCCSVMEHRLCGPGRPDSAVRTHIRPRGSQKL